MPDAVGMAAALLGFLLIMLYGTAFGLMFSCINVIFRDFQQDRADLHQHDPLHHADDVPLLDHLRPVPEVLARDLPRQPGGGGRAAHPARLLVPHLLRLPCATMPNPNGDGTIVPAPEFADHLYTRGFIMLAVGLVLLVLGQWVFARLEKSIPERL